MQLIEHALRDITEGRVIFCLRPTRLHDESGCSPRQPLSWHRFPISQVHLNLFTGLSQIFITLNAEKEHNFCNQLQLYGPSSLSVRITLTGQLQRLLLFVVQVEWIPLSERSEKLNTLLESKFVQWPWFALKMIAGIIVALFFLAAIGLSILLLPAIYVAALLGR